MTMHDHPRAAVSAKLTSLALDLSDHPADAVNALMRSAALILDRTLGGEAAAVTMHEATGEALRLWRASQAAGTSEAKH